MILMMMNGDTNFTVDELYFVEYSEGPSPFHWSQYNVSPPPSASSSSLSSYSSSSSSPSPPVFNYTNYPHVMEQTASSQFAGTGPPLTSSRRPSQVDSSSSSSSSSSVSGRPRAVKRRTRGRANSKCQRNRHTKLHCVPKNVHLFIFQIILSKIDRF